MAPPNDVKQKLNGKSMNVPKNIAIIGSGGFGREVYYQLLSDNPSCSILFYVDDDYINPNSIVPEHKMSELNVANSEVLVAVGDPSMRQRIVNSLPATTKYFTFIHSSAQIMDRDIEIGEGSIICPSVILTTNIKLGKHTHLNLQTTIGHDCVIGDFFTTAPGVKISGNCTIGTRVYFGTNAVVREKITIADDVVIGLNGGVVKNITERGIYAGTPAVRIK